MIYDKNVFVCFTIISCQIALIFLRIITFLFYPFLIFLVSILYDQTLYFFLHVTNLRSIAVACCISVLQFRDTSGWVSGSNMINQSCVSAIVVVDKISIIPEKFSIDRPFVYHIIKIDRKSRDISVFPLFNGFVYNP